MTKSAIPAPARRDVQFAEEERNWGTEYHVKATYRAPNNGPVFVVAVQTLVKDWLPSERSGRMRMTLMDEAYGKLLAKVEAA